MRGSLVTRAIAVQSGEQKGDRNVHGSVKLQWHVAGTSNPFDLISDL